MPDPEKLRNHKHLRIFGSLLNKPNLWALNRRSAPGAFAIGLFVAWMPMPFQMVLPPRWQSTSTSICRCRSPWFGLLTL